MKNKIIFLMIIGVLSSCNEHEESINLETEIIGTWKLIQMNGNTPNSETTGSEMEWQETYELNMNGTFQKSRERDGIIKEVSGTYNLTNNSKEQLLELNFNGESEIIGSCISNTKETLIFQSENCVPRETF